MRYVSTITRHTVRDRNGEPFVVVFRVLVARPGNNARGFPIQGRWQAVYTAPTQALAEAWLAKWTPR